MDAHLSFRIATGTDAGWQAHGSARLHLGVTGSIAAYRAPDLVRAWQDAGLSVSVTLTHGAQQFITPLTFSALGASPVYTALFNDPEAPSPFAHLEPGQVAQAFVVAPASASALARLVQGQADEILSCQALAFRATGHNMILAPAMNPAMWHNPATQANVAVLRSRGLCVLEPGLGRTACGEEGQGRLTDLKTIYLAGLRAFAPQDMQGMRVMLTIGPTREHWDGVRFWTNPSSGTMGASLAVAAWLRGATVEAVCGAGVPWLPSGIRRHDVTSAQDIFTVARDLWPACDLGIFTAAVADFSPVPLDNPQQKFKKNEAPEGFAIQFTPNPDILKTLSLGKRPDQRVIGFAAESQALEQAVHGKLKTKQADMIVGNLIGDGFGGAHNTVFIADASGTTAHWNHLSKPEVAWRVLSWLLSL